MLVKYPKTYHVTWSENYKDTTDRVLTSTEHIEGKPVVVTEKMDGECTTIYSGGKCHARSLDTSYHESRTDVRRIAGEIGHTIPKGFRVCGENMFAKHSLFYDKLPALFLVFNIWDANNICLSWRDTLEFCAERGLQTVPTLYWGTWLKNITHTEINLDERTQEGYVIRLDKPFHFNEFGACVAKYVRANHVQTSEHWLRQTLVKNKVRKS